MAFSDLMRLLLQPSQPAVEPTPVVAEPQPEPEPAIPEGLTLAAGWAWRLLLLGVLVVALAQVAAYFSAVTVPVAIAILLTAFLAPMVAGLRRWGLGPTASAAVALLGMIVVIVGIFVGVGAQVAVESPSLVDKTMQGVDQLLEWLASGPLHIDAAQLQTWWEQAKEWVSKSRAQIASAAASVGSAAGNFFAGLATALMATFFFAAQGRGIFRGTTNLLVPRRYRESVDEAALKGWASLVAYMRAAVIVAAVDAVGVAVAAFALGVPMVWALFALTFFASFIPVVGAVAAGFVAVLLALVTQGPVQALIMLAAVILVMQLEGNLLQPLLLGKAADLHPLAVLLGLTVGATVSGILGALLSIPALAFAVAFVRALRAPASVGFDSAVLRSTGDSAG